MTFLRRCWSALPRSFRILLLIVASASAIHRELRLWAQHLTVSVPGLPAPARPITVHEVDAGAFEARLRTARQEGLTTEARCRRLGLKRLGLVRATEPPLPHEVSSVLGRFAGTLRVPAFYAAGSDTVYTTDRDDRAVRHEWVHAVDDQRGARMRREGTGVTTDEAIALRAAIEGTAITLSGGRAIAMPASTTLDEAALALAYAFGPGFVARVARSPEEALALTPRSTAEVLFGTLSPSTPPLRQAALGPEERLACSDRIGALGVWLAARAAAITPPTAELVARSWADDRLDVVDGPLGPRVFWQVAFTDAAAATQWLSAATQLTLTAPRTQVLGVVYPVVRPSSPLDSLGK